MQNTSAVPTESHIACRLWDNTASKEGDRRKRTINRAQTCDLRSIVEFQPCELQNWSRSFDSNLPIKTHALEAGTYAVDGSGLSG